MRSSKNNERELLKCLHELSHAVGQISYWLEENKDKDDVIKRINRDLSSINERLGRLDVRIGRI